MLRTGIESKIEDVLGDSQFVFLEKEKELQMRLRGREEYHNQLCT
jgi:hypothetical protein